MTDCDTDSRVTCIGCTNRQRGKFGLMVCAKPKQAGLIVPRSTEQLELGRDFAALPQHCPAHKPQPGAVEQVQCTRCGGQGHRASHCPWGEKGPQ